MRKSGESNGGGKIWTILKGQGRTILGDDIRPEGWINEKQVRTGVCGGKENNSEQRKSKSKSLKLSVFEEQKWN